MTRIKCPECGAGLSQKFLKDSLKKDPPPKKRAEALCRHFWYGGCWWTQCGEMYSSMNPRGKRCSNCGKKPYYLGEIDPPEAYQLGKDNTKLFKELEKKK